MAAAFGLVLWRFARAPYRRLGLALLMQLPMSALAYYLVRQPIMELVQPFVGQPDLSLGDVPLRAADRGAGQAVAGAPAVLRPQDRSHDAGVVRLGARHRLRHRRGVVRRRPDRALGRFPRSVVGLRRFIGERVMVATFHSAMVATTLRGWRCWRGGLALGLATAMLMHLLGNLPIGVFPLIFPAAVAPSIIGLFTWRSASAAPCCCATTPPARSTRFPAHRPPAPNATRRTNARCSCSTSASSVSSVARRAGGGA